MHPKEFEAIYLKKESMELELKRMLLDMSSLEYKALSDYDKGGFDGYNQAVTEILKKVQNKIKR